MSKPLVTEMLTFLNMKDADEEPTTQMTEMIIEISESLMEIKM